MSDLVRKADGAWDGSSIRYAYWRVTLFQTFKVAHPGRYVTRKGNTVVVVRIHADWAYGHYACGLPESWYISGRIYPYIECDNDIVRECVWSTVDTTSAVVSGL
jgi:hypothetical protein